MNFCWQLMNEPFVFDQNHPAVFCVESPAAFCTLLTDLHELLESGTEKCSFYENNEPISAEKRLEWIADPFAVSLNQKKILNALYAQLEKQMWSEEYFQKTNEMLSSLQGYLASLCDSTDYPLAFAEHPACSALFKACEIQPEQDHGTLLQRLDAYLQACCEFLKKDVFFFVNLHAYLSANELSELYKTAAYRKYHLFLLESHEPPALPGESRFVMDAGLCQLNFGWQPAE